MGKQKRNNKPPARLHNGGYQAIIDLLKASGEKMSSYEISRHLFHRYSDSGSAAGHMLRSESWPIAMERLGPPGSKTCRYWYQERWGVPEGKHVLNVKRAPDVKAEQKISAEPKEPKACTTLELLYVFKKSSGEVLVTLTEEEARSMRNQLNVEFR